MIDLPYSPAAERNQQPIFEIIEPYLRAAKSVLEIGTGTAQHAAYFAELCPHLVWQTSDQARYLAGIEVRTNVVSLPNLPSPIELDVNSEQYRSMVAQYDVVYSANTLHIMDETTVENFFAGLSNISRVESILILYGPFKVNGEFTSLSNAQFDASLRAQGQGSAIRDREWIEHLAQTSHFELDVASDMPANNQCLIFRRK